MTAGTRGKELPGGIVLESQRPLAPRAVQVSRLMAGRLTGAGTPRGYVDAKGSSLNGIRHIWPPYLTKQR